MSQTLTRFKDKVVLVTGGSSGIGYAAAVAFAREGAQVIVAGRHSERGTHAVEDIVVNSGGEAVFFQADVSRAEDVRNLLHETVRRYGRLDCAFNNAAVVSPSELMRTADLAEEQIDFSIANNMKSVWLCMQAEIHQMLAQRPAGGAIVNTSSVNALGGAPLGSIYSASKAAVLSLTKSAALEYAKDGIRINALVAGAIRTPMLEDAMERLGAGNPVSREMIESRYTSLIPLGRIGAPEEAAEAVLWLCSDAASYMTGNSLILDGGLTAAVR